MVLISSTSFEEAKKLIREMKFICGSVEGSGRKDDERLTKLDRGFEDLEKLLYPATDDR